MAVLITGGTGFLGSRLARLLVERDDAELILLDLFPNVDAVDELAGNVTVIRGDFSQPTETMKVLLDHDVADLFHLAYYTSEAELFPAQAIRVNCDGTNAVFECARLAGVRRVIWPSSAAVYGTATTSASPQWRAESDPVAPNTVYGACKLFNEHIAEVYAERHGFDHVGLRLCSVFGPGRGNRRGIAPDFYAALLDNSLRREPVAAPPADHMVTWGYVDDAAEAFYAAYKADRPPHRIYNFAGGSTTVAEAAAIVGQLCPGTDVRFADEAVRHLSYVNGDLLQQELGFSLSYSPEEAMSDYARRARSTAR